MDKTQVEGRVFRVGDVATASGVTVRTLHYYEEIGLLVPQRTEAGHRAYSSQDVERLSRICLLRRMGLPLSAVARSIESGGTDLRPILENYLEDLAARLHATTALRMSMAISKSAVLAN
ncbi:MAG TPA: MerR family transcriptional regulator [Candidatus Dormibacteraeota bacterium]|nr:MerR family transcriptional regulator [Candidatus Dormibacteraeota bacterium]